MPKVVLTLNDFSGGQNTTTASRDLAPNELTLCQNMDPTNQGRIHTGRIFTTGAITAIGSTPTTGYGLIIWSNDYQLNADATEGFVGQFIGRQDGTSLDVLETSDGVSGTVRDNVLTGLATSPAYYVADGDLYVGGHSSGTFVAPKSLTMHRREDFPGTDIYRPTQDWKTLTQEKAIPNGDDMTALWGYHAAGDAAPAGDSMSAEDLIWIIKIGDEASGSWKNDADNATDEYIELAGSWLYKNKAESDLYNLGLAAYGTGSSRVLDDGEDAEDRAIRVQAWFNSTDVDTSDKAARSGARLYAKYRSSTTWYTLAEVDWEKGIVGDMEIEWKAWENQATASPAPFNNTAANPAICCSTGWIKGPPETFTFEAWNGYIASEIPATGLCHFKTGCVANLRAYVANVKINNRVYPDRILKSPVEQYDVFTEDLIIDTALNDGDEIIKLVSYADRILMFKHNSVMVLNVSQELESVESEIKGAGIDNPGAITITPNGVSWVNRNGAYLFTGEEIKSLNQRQESTQ